MTTEQPRYRTHIGLSEIRPSPTNPRKHFPEAELAELAASIREHGLVTPILLRLADGGTEMYELISGERRWRAAKLAGLTTIPAVVRDDLSPAAVVEIQLIENLQRQDLHPLEEAEGYGRMMREHGYSADTLAEKIGKSRSYIFGRMKLLDLDEDGRRLFYAGALNPSTALLVSRIPSHKLQAKAIEDLTRKDYAGDTMSVREAQRWIRNRYMLALDKAPFPTEDGELIATAGPCSACPKRTGNSMDLFDDIDDINVCTDPDCHAAKKIAAAERRAREAGPDVKVVTGEEAEKIMPSFSSESRTHAKLDSTCYDDPKHRTYREIIGDDQSAVVLVENQNKGELVPVVAKKVITEKLKAQGIVTRAQESRDENKKIKAQVATENAFREELFKAVRGGIRDKLGKIPLLEALIGVVTRRFLIDAGNTRAENVAGLWGAIGANSFDRSEAFRKGMINYTSDEQLLICLDLALLAELKTDEHNLKRKPEGMLAMAAALEIDADALLKATKEAKKPAAKAKKSTKKAHTTTSDDPPNPSEAAQAAESDRAKEDAAPEAAPAGEENPPEKTTAEEQKSAAGAAVEKTSGSERLFAIGDRVRVRDIPDPRYGIKPVFAGREGLVSSFWYSNMEYGVTIAGRETLYIQEMLEAVEKSVIEIDEKPPATNRPSVQYRHPQNAELEWTGRGRKPKWVEHWITQGGTLDDLKIEGVAA
jgi:ParB/RepB/Spo0J family partition protein